MFVVLRDQPVPATSGPSSPWISLVSRRFGGDVYDRTVTLRKEDGSGESAVIHVRSLDKGLFDISVRAGGTDQHFSSVRGHLQTPTTLSASVNEVSVNTTIVSQKPPAAVPASTSPNTMERLHIFHGGHKTTLLLPSPKWLLSLSSEVLHAAKGGLKAPMPSVVVEVRVSEGDRVEKGQPVVVLESMKTETVLRAPAAGVVKSVGCKKGEMVEEGRELVDIEEVEESA